MNVGDRVVFAVDPLLYGVQRIGVKTADGRFVCEPAHPAVPNHKRRPEVFFGHELARFDDPLVDIQAAAEALRAREEAQEAGPKPSADTDSDAEGQGSE